MLASLLQGLPESRIASAAPLGPQTVQAVRVGSSHLLSGFFQFTLELDHVAVKRRGFADYEGSACVNHGAVARLAELSEPGANNAVLPRPTGIGNWLQDVSITVVHYMLDTGMTQDMFYCPSNATHEKDRDALWTFANDSWDGNRFTDFGRASFIVSGYLFIIQGAKGAPQ